jgi:hypothetical protein
MFTALALYLSGQVSGDGTDGTTGKWKYSQSIGHQSLPGEFCFPGGFLWQFKNAFPAHMSFR